MKSPNVFKEGEQIIRFYALDYSGFGVRIISEGLTTAGSQDCRIVLACLNPDER
jgi:hypothetical protein